MKLLKVVFFLIVSVVFLNPVIAIGKDSLKAYSQKFKSSISLSPMVSILKKNQTYISTKNVRPTPGIGINYRGVIPLCKNFSATIGLDYFNYKVDFDGDYYQDTAFNYNHKLNIYELQVPLMAKINLPKFYCTMGVNYRYPVKAWGKITSKTNGQALAEGATDIKTFGIILGYAIASIGKEFQLKNRYKIFVELQYKKSINELSYLGITSKTGNFLVSNDVLISNSVILFSIGIPVHF